MRLLLTAELHYRLSWFKWLQAQAVHYEAIAICGDLLDVFYKEPLKRQAQRTTGWLRTLAEKTSVIVCSGNHDTVDIPVEPHRSRFNSTTTDLALRLPRASRPGKL